MAQSCTSKTDDSSIESSTSKQAASWFTERRRWDFQAKIADFACYYSVQPDRLQLLGWPFLSIRNRHKLLYARDRKEIERQALLDHLMHTFDSDPLPSKLYIHAPV